MQLVLYAPGLGYYVAGARKFGAAGDFVTAPEMTPLFARALAAQVAAILAATTAREIVELGAGSGALAADLLNALAGRDALPSRYAILEVSPDLRERQRAEIARRAPEHVAMRRVARRAARDDRRRRGDERGARRDSRRISWRDATASGSSAAWQAPDRCTGRTGRWRDPFAAPRPQSAFPADRRLRERNQSGRRGAGRGRRPAHDRRRTARSSTTAFRRRSSITRSAATAR